MKHGEFVKEQMKLYPFHISRKCINYQRWKLWIKTQPWFIKRYWKILIIKDCRRINRFLFPLFCNKVVPDDWVFSLCLLNTDTFYKICKKLDRNMNVGAMNFYKKCIARRIYKFTYMSRFKIINSL